VKDLVNRELQAVKVVEFSVFAVVGGAPLGVRA